jgi:di/tricarboxylate transporter
MTWEILFVFAIILIALALFITERYAVDQVALVIPVVLLLAGILSPAEALSGFSNEATITVAAMLCMSLGLVKTGAVATIGRWAQNAPLGGPRLRLVVLSLVVAGISPFLNNTAVVVVFLPVFLALAQRDNQPPSLYLMPLSFAAILGGTITLLGTSTNLLVYGLIHSRGFDQLSMFSIAPLGLIFTAVGLAYLFTVGRSLLPRRVGMTDLTGKYEVRSFVTELTVRQGSPAVGRSLGELKWGSEFDVSILGLRRRQRTLWSPGPNRRLMVGDTLFAKGHHEDLLWLAIKQGLAMPTPSVGGPDLESEDAHLAEVLVAPGASVVGRTLAGARFQQRYHATVLAVQHLGETIRTRLPHVRLEAGDLLLVHGTAPDLDALVGETGLVPLGAVRRPTKPRPRALFAVGVLIAVVAVAGFNLLPIMTAALTGVLLMVFTRCVRLEEIYAELDWMVVFLLAGVIPLGVAMDKTGAAQWLADAVAASVGPLGPHFTVAAFYLLTSLLTSVMSNNATAVVLTPIALLTAADLGMNPYALVVAVMFGASASFMTPVGYQTNTLIYAPGGYRFFDFIKVGTPLNFLLLVTATILIPLFWPS